MSEDKAKLSSNENIPSSFKKQKDISGVKIDSKTKKLQLLKNKFESMDFSLRERINNKFIEHLQMSGKFTLPELIQKHVDMSKTQRIIKDIFPPDNFEYQQIENLKHKKEELHEEFDLDHEVLKDLCSDYLRNKLLNNK